MKKFDRNDARRKWQNLAYILATDMMGSFESLAKACDKASPRDDWDELIVDMFATRLKAFADDRLHGMDALNEAKDILNVEG